MPRAAASSPSGRAALLSLAALLLRRGELAAVDVLVEEVWGEQRLANAANALQVQGVPAPGAGLARHRPAGAAHGRPVDVLDVDPSAVDAIRFESSSGRRVGLASVPPADAAPALHEPHLALDLWRGAPHQDLPDAPSAVAEIALLEEATSALEYEIDARWRSASTNLPCRRCAS